jgi:hypothetical protein
VEVEFAPPPAKDLALLDPDGSAADEEAVDQR